MSKTTPEDLAKKRSDEKMLVSEMLALYCLVADQTLTVEQLEESEFEPMFSDLEGSLNGKKIALFGSYGWGNGLWMRDWVERAQSDGAHCGAAKCNCIKLCQLCGVHFATGNDGAVCTLCHAVCHGLRVAGCTPEYNCYFAHKEEPLFQFWLVYSNFYLQEIALPDKDRTIWLDFSNHQKNTTGRAPCQEPFAEFFRANSAESPSAASFGLPADGVAGAELADAISAPPAGDLRRADGGVPVAAPGWRSALKNSAKGS